MPKQAKTPRYSLTLPVVPDDSPLPSLSWRSNHSLISSPQGPAAMDHFHLPPMEHPSVLEAGGPVYSHLYKGHLYKSQLGSSLPDLSSRLERQRQRLPRQYEKISFQVRTEKSPVRTSRIGYLPVLTPRTPIIVESRAQHLDSNHTPVSHHPSENHVVEIHADVLDQTFHQNAKPGAQPPWKHDCFCPRCSFMREKWVEQNRKPFRPFSRQREPTFLSITTPLVSHQSVGEQESVEPEMLCHQAVQPMNNSGGVNEQLQQIEATATNSSNQVPTTQSVST